MDGRVAWIPSSPSGQRPISDALSSAEAPYEPTEEELAHRNTLALAAQGRYDVWAASNTESPSVGSSMGTQGLHPSKHTFRDRDTTKELHSTMSFRLGHRTEKERIAASISEHPFLKRPLYESPGANTIGMKFSYQRRGYLMRQRMKSMEVGGPWRFSALTEGQRIMDGRDARTMSFPQSEEEQRLHKDAHAMYRRPTKDKWVGGRDFHRGPRPLREPFNRFESLANEPYVERPDQDTYGNLNFGHARVRNKALEVRAFLAPRAPPALCFLLVSCHDARLCAPAQIPRGTPVPPCPLPHVLLLLPPFHHPASPFRFAHLCPLSSPPHYGHCTRHFAHVLADGQ